MSFSRSKIQPLDHSHFNFLILAYLFFSVAFLVRGSLQSSDSHKFFVFCFFVVISNHGLSSDILTYHFNTINNHKRNVFHRVSSFNKATHFYGGISIEAFSWACNNSLNSKFLEGLLSSPMRKLLKGFLNYSNSQEPINEE